MSPHPGKRETCPRCETRLPVGVAAADCPRCGVEREREAGTPARCRGKTARGEPCGRLSDPATGFCWSHSTKGRRAMAGLQRERHGGAAAVLADLRCFVPALEAGISALEAEAARHRERIAPTSAAVAERLAAELEALRRRIEERKP